MRFISTRVHGCLDYPLGLLLIAAPWLLGFADGGPAQWVPVLVGMTILIASVMTDYELGLVRMIPMPVHLMLDMVAGLLLLVSPWLFGFSHVVVVPHVIVGLLEIGAAAMTSTQPSRRELPA